MRPWLLRGAVLAVLHAAADVLIAAYRIESPTSLTFLRALTLGVLVGVAALWGAVDGLFRRPDRGRTWMYASVTAGLLAAVLSLVVKAVLLDQTSSRDVFPAITGGAAFSALLVLVPAGIGIAVGSAMQQPGRTKTSADETDEIADEDEPDDEKPRPSPRPSPRPRRARGAQRGNNKVAPPG